MGTQMQLRLSMAWGEEAVRRRAEMTAPPPWPTEMSERSKFTREEYRDLPGPDPKRNVDHPDLGYLAVADRNWPGGEDGNCSGREWGWEMKRGPTLTPASTDGGPFCERAKRNKQGHNKQQTTGSNVLG